MYWRTWCSRAKKRTKSEFLYSAPAASHPDAHLSRQATDGAEDSAVEEAAKSLVELPNRFYQITRSFTDCFLALFFSIKLEDSKRKGGWCIMLCVCE